MKLIPELSVEIDALAERVDDPKFLNGESMEKIWGMLQDLDDIEKTFQELEARKEKYNNWQFHLEIPQDPFENLEDLRTEMNLRCLMWRSLQSW